MPKVTPCFLFNDQSLDAAEFYVSVFPNSKVNDVNYYGEGAPRPAGSVLTVAFTLDGEDYLAINSWASFAFSESLSFMVHCASQGEVDSYWEQLTAGGEEGRCGWLKDRFGVSWQIVPDGMFAYLGDPDPERAQRAMQAMLGMRKLDLAVFQAAVDAG
jgi:predicted 3-demethylubiquinone-9 3-methyltransferase (glyoxalase superfamily)